MWVNYTLFLNIGVGKCRIIVIVEVPTYKIITGNQFNLLWTKRTVYSMRFLHSLGC